MLRGLVSSDILATISPRTTNQSMAKAELKTSWATELCQDGVSDRTRDGLALEQLAFNISEGGWLVDEEGKLTNPIHIVEMDDGTLCL